MKRPLFIIIGAILVLILIAVWIYVLFFNVPGETDDQYTDLNLGNTTDINYVPPDDSTDVSGEPLVNVGENQRLKQLTTKPVIGFTEVGKENLPEAVQYVEAGTGHIFSINLATGEEERISATTIPSSHSADFSGNGKYVLIQAGSGSGATFTVGTLSTTSDQMRTSQIFGNVISFKGTPSGNFLYAEQTNSSVVGKSYNPITLNTTTLFTVPFREAIIQWGSEASDSHYVYPKASSQLEGFLYEIKNGVLSRLPIDGYGLSAVGNNDYVVFSKLVDEEYTTYLYDRTSGEIESNLFIQIPEKCTFSADYAPVSVCANTASAYGSTMPEAWYTGEAEFGDTLYLMQNDIGRAIRMIDTKFSIGQNLDIVDLDLGIQEASVYFSNKNDDTLWMYEIIPTSSLSPIE